MTTLEQPPDFEQIRELASRAALIKHLIEKGAAKRPLIIEFSGAPKAGKTRSISVLELFLKRNGLKVEVFTERASIAPIKSKGHLKFNLWVSCSSLQGMLESLYRDIDVFILDRGVFDALVWNEWLEMTGKITREEATQVAEFFTMDCCMKLIDVVFVLSCNPETSIDREYAGQLTTKRDTIMPQHTRNEIKQATEKTLRTHGSKFKKIVPFDTTKTDAREGVAKIADEALKVLSGFLDESICVVPVNAVKIPLPKSGLVDDRATISAFTEIVKTDTQFLPRSDAEQNANFLQPIPCALSVTRTRSSF